MPLKQTVQDEALEISSLRALPIHTRSMKSKSNPINHDERGLKQYPYRVLLLNRAKTDLLSDLYFSPVYRSHTDIRFNNALRFELLGNKRSLSGR